MSEVDKYWAVVVRCGPRDEKTRSELSRTRDFFWVADRAERIDKTEQGGRIASWCGQQRRRLDLVVAQVINAVGHSTALRLRTFVLEM